MTTQTRTITGDLRQMAGISSGIAALMIALGILSIALPQVTGLGIAIMVAWITIFAGLMHLTYAFAAENAGSFLWRLLIGVAYIAGGFYLAVHPDISLESLTLVLAAMFFAEGILRIVLFFQTRGISGAGWILFDGVLSIILGFLIARNWPSSSAWAIGTLVGVNLCVSGVSRLMFSVTARRALTAQA